MIAMLAQSLITIQGLLPVRADGEGVPVEVILPAGVRAYLSAGGGLFLVRRESTIPRLTGFVDPTAGQECRLSVEESEALIARKAAAKAAREAREAREAKAAQDANLG